MPMEDDMNEGTDDIVEVESADRRRLFNVFFRVLVPNGKMGSLIGKQGATAKSIRKDTGANIVFSAPIPGFEERIIAVYCSVDHIIDWSPAEDALIKLLDLVNSTSSKADDEGSDEFSAIFRLKLLVTSSQSGPLIGKVGAMINSIREKSGASIRLIEEVPSIGCAGDRAVCVTGDRASVREAVLMICNQLKSFPGTEGMADLLNFNVFRDQRDFLNSIRPTNGLAQNNNAPILSRIIERPSLQVKTLSAKESGRGFEREDGKKRLRSGETEAKNISSGIFPNTVTKMLITDADVGRVIGKKGSNINKIRTESNASLSITEANPGSRDCLLEIVGTLEQVSAAQQMVLESVVGPR